MRETCEIQDRINVGFESKQKKLETELKQHEDEKGELQVRQGINEKVSDMVL